MHLERKGVRTDYKVQGSEYYEQLAAAEMSSSAEQRNGSANNSRPGTRDSQRSARVQTPDEEAQAAARVGAAQAALAKAEQARDKQQADTTSLKKEEGSDVGLELEAVPESPEHRQADAAPQGRGIGSIGSLFDAQKIAEGVQDGDEKALETFTGVKPATPQKDLDAADAAEARERGGRFDRDAALREGGLRMGEAVKSAIYADPEHMLGTNSPTSSKDGSRPSTRDGPLGTLKHHLVFIYTL